MVLSREIDEIVISSRRGRVSGERLPPRTYGWWAMAVTFSRVAVLQPCSRAARPVSRRPERLMHSRSRQNSAVATGRRTSGPDVLPIGAVSPSRIWSPPCPVACSPEIAAAASWRYSDGETGINRRPRRTHCGVSQRPTFASFIRPHRPTRGREPPAQRAPSAWANGPTRAGAGRQAWRAPPDPPQREAQAGTGVVGVTITDNPRAAIERKRSSNGAQLA